MSTATRSFQIIRPLGAGSILLALLALAPPVHAQRRDYEPNWRGDRPAAGRLVSVEVRVDGHRAPLYQASGAWDRHYFEAERGENYELRIRNRTGRRVGVLISVDGLNVVNGERSALGPNEPMYILDPWKAATIRGWRTSLDQVRRFVFVDEERSYASRTDQANGDMGWIRVLAFEEERPVAVSPPRWRDREDRPRDEVHGDADSKAEASKPGAGAEKSGPQTSEQSPRSLDNYPGTGWGDRRHDPVRETWFDPASFATDHIVLRYEYESGLQALGIFPDSGDRLGDRERGDVGFARWPRW